MQRAALNPRSLTHGDVTQLQRMIGNAGVRQLATRASGRDPSVPLSMRGSEPGQAGKVVQRQLIFGEGAEFLDPANESRENPFPGYYKNVLAVADSISEIITIRKGEVKDAKAAYTKDETGAYITVVGQNEAYEGNQSAQAQELRAQVSAVVHEAQHAIDDLHPSSKLQGKLTTDQVLAEDKLLSEVHAHAKQASLAKEMIGLTGTYAATEDDRAIADFTAAAFERGGWMYKKLLYYVGKYGYPYSRDIFIAKYRGEINAAIATVESGAAHEFSTRKSGEDDDEKSPLRSATSTSTTTQLQAEQAGSPALRAPPR